jgi:hypothetical protein
LGIDRELELYRTSGELMSALYFAGQTMDENSDVGVELVKLTKNDVTVLRARLENR